MSKEEQDRICIKDLELDCVIGVNPDERVRKQRIYTDIELITDVSQAGATDSLEDTVSYSEVATEIIEHAEASSYMLIESLAEAIARICLKPDSVHSVRVFIKKPGAVRKAAYAGVEIFRRRRKATQQEA